jgi:hypothetical protein
MSMTLGAIIGGLAAGVTFALTEALIDWLRNR